MLTGESHECVQSKFWIESVCLIVLRVLIHPHLRGGRWSGRGGGLSGCLLENPSFLSFICAATEKLRQAGRLAARLA